MILISDPNTRYYKKSADNTMYNKNTFYQSCK